MWAQNPGWWNQLYYNVLHNIDQGCLGSVFFEYSDEPYKADILQVCSHHKHTTYPHHHTTHTHTYNAYLNT